MEASMLAVARWSPANQIAASLVGANMMNGWATAAAIWPRGETSRLLLKTDYPWGLLYLY